MSSSRAESQASQYGRRRSNTAQSLYRPPPPPSLVPLRFGDTKTLTIWVHDPSQPPGPNVILNHAHWPGVVEGDMLADETSGFLFSVQKDEASARQQLSIPRPIAEKFDLRNHGEVTLTKIDRSKYCADYVELTFQDQYLGRNEMWRLGSHLVGQCIYVQQEISFIGVIGAKVQAIYVDGRKVPAAYVTPATKTLYRSLSAKITIFIQVCRELWQFAGDGERYNEKIVHSFLPELFAQWNEAKTNHIVTIVLISRVFYDSSEIDYAAGPLRQDDSGRWYKDFFKVITDLEVLYDWKPTLVDLKTSFWKFQRDILLAHHFHRASLSSEAQPEQVRLVGQLSYARDGPLLEALNLGLNPTETHYIDRSLSLTGSSTIVITPGTGYFHVSKELLRLTTTRLLDQGFAVELVSLAKPPLHQSPIFSFQAVDPELTAAAVKGGPRAFDPLWADDDASREWDVEKTTFWWEPFWMTVSYWDKQMDQPIRPDRFVARAKMHEIEMLGLLDHDVLSNIEIPFLTNLVPNESTGPVTTEDADQFDSDIFSCGQEPQASSHIRRSLTLTSSGSGTLSRASTVRLSGSLRLNAVNRASTSSAFPSIEESPRNPLLDLPAEGFPRDVESRLLSATSGGLSTSPSQSSMRSVRSSHSHRSTGSAMSSTSHRSRSGKPPLPRGSTSMKSRLTPSWLFNPFRSGISQPQTSPVSISTSGGGNSESQGTSHSSNSSNTSTAVPTPETYSPEKKAIQIPRSNSLRKRPTDEETLVSRQASPKRLSPLNASPRDSFLAGRRRTISKTSTQLSIAPSAPLLRTNPSKPTAAVPYPLSSLARRWQHLFPQPLSKHDTKWKAMIIPGCLPLTTEFFPSMSELETTYDMHPYDFVVEPSGVQSFLVRPPSMVGNADDVRRAWALVVMRGMVAVRLAQGFQFVIRPPKSIQQQEDAHNALRRTRSYLAEDDMSSKPAGIADVLKSADEPVYLSMSNEIHRIAYIGDSVQVRRWVRTMPRARPLNYQCLIWPKLGVGYTELMTSFVSHGLENYGWNRLDMLVAGYESQFNDSIRYWRTRFVVIPTDESPGIHSGPNGEELNDEEVRLLGIDKLAELFSRARWIPPEDRGKPVPPLRFLTTDLDPAASVLDESLTAQLEEIHASGPLRKKPKSAKDISDMSLAVIAKAMREEDGVPIKEHRWHGRKYANSFTGSDFVSWLVREFRDVSNREQGTEWGAKLQEQGLFEHCRGAHGFLDGHYFYTLRGEYLVPMTPRGGGWFRAARHVSGEESSVRTAHYPGNVEKGSPASRKARKRLIFSQSMVIDIDPNKRSDQAESVILHHDIIHNPATCFHFELQWIGTTARCIDDLLRQWSRSIERYGLKLVEAYVTQICDIQERNPFQSCFPLPLAEPPPIVPDFEKRVAEGVQTRHYFEYAILRKFGFVVDIEAASLYPDSVDVVYSYRRSPFKYSQWVHRSGVAFVQVLGGREGFLFLTNRLMAPGRLGTALNHQRPAAAAEHIRIKMQRLCSDREALRRFYEEELAQLPPTLEEPPPLRI
ncbi:uncharacterized protein C8Q71DRAFT_713521 [Rhodofomes roseus]|uniref:Vacuolar membrane-associated protein IML1 n=1 Tax=Rhodofomes roseus TaxID=34475 RepID=A0ABQ8K6K6_9APHY|nr:uncharacterized protein C8Q71DRAFT_713521 [Rhodofomes roseus]KAH9832871.1 hypothetical protein C8Q71DRAFT_713521 [Rhodofomes roseus]